MNKFFLPAILFAAFLLFGCIQPGDLAGGKQGSNSLPAATPETLATSPAPGIPIAESILEQPPALPEGSEALAQDRPPALPSDEPGAATQTAVNQQSDQLPALPSEESGESASATPSPSDSAGSITPTPEATSDELPQIPI